MQTHLRYQGTEDTHLQGTIPASLPAIWAQPRLHSSHHTQGHKQRGWGLRLIPACLTLPMGMLVLPQICSLRCAL